MTKMFKVKNWDLFQHYKDRTPPWIKLHNHLLDDYEFECLEDNQKAHLLCIWMLASRTNNKMPFNESWVKKKIGASTKVNLNALVSAGFLVVEHDASKPLQSPKQDATESVPSEEERRGEKEKSREEDINSPDKSDSQVIYNMPLVDNTMFEITLAQCELCASSYPAVHLDTELRKMIAWLDANPKKRKTRNGFKRFANNWLSKVQDKGGNYERPQNTSKQLSAQERVKQACAQQFGGSEFSGQTMGDNGGDLYGQVDQEEWANTIIDLDNRDFTTD